MAAPPEGVEVPGPGGRFDFAAVVRSVLPASPALTAAPWQQGEPLQELSIHRLSSAVEWLVGVVQSLQANSAKVEGYLGNCDIDARLESLEFFIAHHNESHPSVLARLDMLERNLEEMEARLMARLDGMEADFKKALGNLPGGGPDVSGDIARLLERMEALERKVNKIKIPPPIDIDALLAPILARLKALEDEERYPPAKNYDDELDDIRRRLDALEAIRDTPVVQEVTEEPKKRKPGTRPVVLSKPLEVSRDFLDLKNHRHLQDLGQEHAGLKAALSAFEVAIINETSRLGTYIISVRNEFEQELNKFKHEMEIELGKRPTWEELYAHEAPRIALEDKQFEEIAVELAEHIRRIDTTDRSLSEFADETRAIDANQDTFVNDLSARMDSVTTELSLRFNALDCKLRKGPVTMESLTRIDVVEEVKRLRHMVESVKNFDQDGLIGARNEQTPAVGGKLTIRTGGDAQAKTHHAELEVLVQEQQRNTSSLLRGFERDIARVNTKVDDVRNLLKPIQTQTQCKPGASPTVGKEVAWVLVGGNETAVAAADKAGGPQPEKGVLLGLVQRSDQLEAELRRVRGDLEASLASKAEVSALAGRLDAWVTSPPGGTLHGAEDQTGGYDQRDTLPLLQTPWRKSSPPRDKRGAAPPGSDKPKWYSVGGERHDRCARPTCPATLRVTQSAGRLPIAESHPAAHGDVS